MGACLATAASNSTAAASTFTVAAPTSTGASTFTAAASTSNDATLDSNYQYNIFISHRGPDVKKTIASHLYRRLLSHGLRVFLDQSELQQGDDLTFQIDSAIRSASVHLAIFSAGYADSVWCLKELVLMLESDAPIIPVFYDVKPAELRWTRGKTGRYARALEELEKKTTSDPQTREKKLRYDSDTIESWRTALSRAAEIVGFELEACDSDEGELVDKVVERVLKKVKKPALALDVAKYPTGLDDKVKDFEKLLLSQQNERGKPQIFGIWGLGGVGKTTLAKEFFNRKNSVHSTSCFLSDVRDNAGKGCLISLQKRLLKSLNVSHKTVACVESVDEGIWMLRTHLSIANALVVLDDVDQVEQIDALLPHQTTLHSDSLILITSRNRDVLTCSKVKKTSIYHLTGLDEQHSRELLCSYAFHQPYPRRGYEHLVYKFLKTCEGLPLSLKVFGALLCDKDISYCEDQLESLQHILPSTAIHRIFKISYDSLRREEQHIFLDIACFLRGQSKDTAIKIWDASGWKGRMGFQNLENKSLVEVNNLNQIHMHDHLRDMGRDIADSALLRDRIWRWTEKTIEDLVQQSATLPMHLISLYPNAFSLRGLRMGIVEYNRIGSDDVFGLIRGLQLLDTEDFVLQRILTKVQLPNLIWLRWNASACSYLPPSISLENLRVLQVSGLLQTLWEDKCQVPLQLRELHIDALIRNIPESIGQLKQLERIVINIRFLSKLPEEFCLLQSLKTLFLRDGFGWDLETVPNSFANLSNVRHIEPCSCPSLETLPYSNDDLSGSMPYSDGNLLQDNEQHIVLNECYSLKMLPDSFGNLSNLRHIEMDRCFLEKLPDSFGNLTNLQYIKFNELSNLKKLPDSFGNLSNLQHIEFNMAWKSPLEGLPNTFGNLTNLQYIKLNGLSFKKLPISIGNLSNLQHMDLSRCINLKTLPESFGNLSNLQRIKLSNCFSLEKLPDSFGNLTNLQSIDMSGKNKKLKSISGLAQLTKLQELLVSGCLSLERVEGIQYCMSLRRVHAEKCPELQWSEGVVEQLRQRVTDLRT